MKVTLNIPYERINALLELTKTKTEAINKAIKEYIHQEKVKVLLAPEGSCSDFMTQGELLEMREMELRELEPNHAIE